MQARSLISSIGAIIALSTVFLGYHENPVTQAAALFIAGSLSALSGDPLFYIIGLLATLDAAVAKGTHLFTTLTTYLAPYLTSVAVIAKFWKLPFTWKNLRTKNYYASSALSSLGISLIVMGGTYITNADRLVTTIPPIDSPLQLFLISTLSALAGASLGNTKIPITIAVGIAVPVFPPLSLIAASLGAERYHETVRYGVFIGELVGIIENNNIKRIKGNAYLDFSEPGTHTTVVGATGTGKSRLVRVIAKELKSMNYAVIVIDTHGEHSVIDSSTVLLPRDIRLDLAYGGKQEIDDITDIISEAFRLGPIQRAVLHEVMNDVYEKNEGTLSLRDIIEELSSDSTTPVKRSLVSYMRSMAKYFGDEGVSVQELLRPGSINVIDISGLGHVASRVFVDILMRSLIYSVMRNPTKTAIVVEEAHRFIGGRSSALGRLFREGRKFGMTALVTTQSPTDIPSDVYVNSRYIISFSVADARGASYLAQTLSGGIKELYLGVRKALATLRKGEALLWDRERGHVYIIKTS